MNGSPAQVGAPEGQGQHERDEQVAEDGDAQDGQVGVVGGDQLEPGEGEQAGGGGPVAEAVGRQGEVGILTRRQQPAVQPAHRVDQPPDAAEDHGQQAEADPQPDVDDVGHRVVGVVLADDQGQQGPGRERERQRPRRARARPRCRARGRGPAAAGGRRSGFRRGFFHSTPSATNDTTRARAAPMSSRSNGSGRSSREPTPWAGRAAKGGRRKVVTGRRSSAAAARGGGSPPRRRRAACR